MRISRVVTTAALSAGAVVATAGAAYAAPATAVPEVKNVVVTGTNPDQAVVHVKYRCSGEPIHLWASVKQGPGIDPATGHTGSADADAWYETTDEELTPTCDGQSHVLRYTLDRVGGFDRLHSGPAYVQFVIFYADSNGFQRQAWSDPGAFFTVR